MSQIEQKELKGMNLVSPDTISGEVSACEIYGLACKNGGWTQPHNKEKYCDLPQNIGDYTKDAGDSVAVYVHLVPSGRDIVVVVNGGNQIYYFEKGQAAAKSLLVNEAQNSNYAGAGDVRFNSVGNICCSLRGTLLCGRSCGMATRASTAAFLTCLCHWWSMR